jgi:putative two-component system response regulator
MDADMRFRILIVEDEAALRRALEQYLAKSGYFVVGVARGADAVTEFSTSPFDLVLTDINLPDASGLDLVEHARKANHCVDVIMMTGFYDQGFALDAMRHGAYDFFIKPVNFDKLKLTIERVREKQLLEADRERLAILKREQVLQFETTMALCNAAEERDRSNRGHGRRTAMYSEWMAQRLCFTEEKTKILSQAALLHDIGKIGVDDAILNKPGKLTPGEAKQMRFHSEIGAYILQPMSIFRAVAPIVRWHHEHYDGQGYPDGLKGEGIPMESRIVAVADYYDALTSLRPYREPDSVENALAVLRQERGCALDPMLVELFSEIVRERHAQAAAGVESLRSAGSV